MTVVDTACSWWSWTSWAVRTVRSQLLGWPARAAPVITPTGGDAVSARTGLHGQAECAAVQEGC